jgi:hypothetical protein
MPNNCTFSKILQKVKSFFLAISIILYLIPIKFETLKPPNVQSYTYRSMILKSYKQMSEVIIGNRA